MIIFCALYRNDLGSMLRRPRKSFNSNQSNSQTRNNYDIFEETIIPISRPAHMEANIAKWAHIYSTTVINT